MRKVPTIVWHVPEFTKGVGVASTTWVDTRVECHRHLHKSVHPPRPAADLQRAGDLLGKALSNELDQILVLQWFWLFTTQASQILIA